MRKSKDDNIEGDNVISGGFQQILEICVVLIRSRKTESKTLPSANFWSLQGE